MASVGSCIASNPDISGIGVRTAIYAQNILSFAPAVFALLDKKVSPTELETLETQSTTILITAFAILVSTIVQALTEGITNYHAAIILNLSWMNNTNLFIYFLLYVYHRSGLRMEDTDPDAELKEGPNPVGSSRSIWTSEITRALKNPVFIIGSLHLSLMAAVGLWLWSRPASFGNSLEAPCSLSASLVILGQEVALSSLGLRTWALLTYGVLLVPIFNLVIPILLFLGPVGLYNRYHRKSSRQFLNISQISAGLCVLAIVDIIILADTEVTLKNNKPLIIDGDDTAWTFGQTLALLLLLVPLCDLGETLLERRPRKVGKKLMSASEDGKPEVVEHLIKQGPRTTTKNLALRVAVQNGHVDVVRVLIAHRVNVHLRDPNGRTLIHLAAAQGRTGVLKLLTKSGVNATTKDHSGKAAIDLAIAGLHDKAVIYLLGGDVDAEETSGQKAIHWVAEKGLIDVVKGLIVSGANVNEYDSLGRQPLHLAARGGHMDIVKYLIEHGAKVNEKDTISAIPLNVALESARIGRRSDFEYDSDCESASYSDSDSNHSTAPLEDAPCSALCLAAGQGHTKIVKYLLDHGADLENDRAIGNPLYRAIRGRHADVVRCLVERGAEVNAYGVGGYTPLSAAVKIGHLNIVKSLVEHGANVDEHLEDSSDTVHVFPSGVSLLRRALQASKTEVMKYLIERGASMSNEDPRRDTFLYISAERGFLDMVRFLVAHGASADLNKRNREGLTPLGRAVEQVRIGTIKCLIELGADVNQQYSYIVGLDVDGDVPFDVYRRGTGLHSAARYGATDTMRCLYERGVNINARGSNGWTALHEAAEYGRIDSVKFLLERGADFGIADKQGRTPLQVAEENYYMGDVAEYLRRLST